MSTRKPRLWWAYDDYTPITLPSMQVHEQEPEEGPVLFDAQGRPLRRERTAIGFAIPRSAA